MKNKKKKIVAPIVVATVLVGSIVHGDEFIKFFKSDDGKIQNKYGYENVNPFWNIKVDEQDFVVLKVGNHDKTYGIFDSKKMKFCNSEDISLGLVIESEANNECDIYDDVEYVKCLVRDYKIDYPVYLDIDKIITDTSLNTEMKTIIIRDFLNKCAANNIYVGIYGSRTNLYRCKKYCGIEGYDSFLVEDNSDYDYDGVHNVTKDSNGIITSEDDLSKAIKDKELNNSSSFVSDGGYRIRKGEEIIDVSLDTGISVDELLAFNDIDNVEDVKEGDLLRVPSRIASKKLDKFEKLDEPLRGCDISYCQKNNCDWNEMKKNFDFIILRSNQGLDKDSCFEDFAFNCNINGLPIGAYCFNQYSKDNCEDIDVFAKKQTEQVNYTLELLKNKEIEYPVYLDIEKAGGVDSKFLPKEYVVKMLDIWRTKISGVKDDIDTIDGYIPGIYCNQSTFNYLQSCVDYDLSSKFQVWIAGGEQYTGENTDIDISKVRPSSVLDGKYGATMAQSTDSCVNSGAGNGRGHVDVDFSLVDYSDRKNLVSEEQFKIKEFKRSIF